MLTRRQQYIAGLGIVLFGAVLTANLAWPLLAQEPPVATAPIKAVASERWRTMSVGGQRIGYEHHTVSLRPGSNPPVVITEARVHMRPTLRGSSQRVRADVLIRTEETEDGRLLSFTYEEILPKPLYSTRKVGTVTDGKLVVETTKGSRSVSKEIPLPAGVAGPGYADRFLLQNPLKPGETRTLTTFDPRTLQADTVTIVAGKMEPVLLGDGTEKSLLHVVSTHSIAEGIEFHEFLDDAGNVLKTTVPSQEMVLHTVAQDVVLKAYPDARPTAPPAEAVR